MPPVGALEPGLPAKAPTTIHAEHKAEHAPEPSFSSIDEHVLRD